MGFYLHFLAVPVWDVYTPANGPIAATDTIDVANFGVSWGFSIVAVPEPSTMALGVVGVIVFVPVVLRRRRAGADLAPGDFADACRY